MRAREREGLLKPKGRGMAGGVFQGSLFSSDFLRESINRLPD